MRLEHLGSDTRYSLHHGNTGITSSALSSNKIGLAADTLRRFLSKIHYKPVGCWYWTAGTFPTGYGMFNLGRDVNGKQITAYAHRIAYELANGHLGNLQAQHHCDVRPCVRPDHIYAGTQSENMRDRTVRGRFPCSVPKNWKGWPSNDLRRQVIAECLASPRRSGTVARLAREHNIKFNKLAVAVWRARKREFLANTTGVAAAVR